MTRKAGNMGEIHAEHRSMTTAQHGCGTVYEAAVPVNKRKQQVHIPLLSVNHHNKDDFCTEEIKCSQVS